MIRRIKFKSYILYNYFKNSIKFKEFPSNYFILNNISNDKTNSSKYELNKYIPEKNRIKTIKIFSKDPIEDNKNKILLNFKFPIILKPEEGFSSYGIIKINDITELFISLNKIKNTNLIYVIQEFITSKKELDIFYIKDENKIKILSITEMFFPDIIGDGVNTIKKLIKNSNLKNKNKLLKINLKNKNKILLKDENYQLSFKNSIYLGTKYKDLTVELKHIDNILCKYLEKIKKYKINRISIKTNSIEDLMKGDFKIFEMNILFPAPINLLDESLSKKYKLDYINFFMSSIFMIIKKEKNNNNLKTKHNHIKFIFKNMFKSKKIKRLGQ